MSTLYEQVMDLAIKLGHEAEALRGTRTENDGPQEEMDDEVGIAHEEIAGRIIEILNASEEADTAGSASSQHFIETGVRLPLDADLGINAKVWRSDLDDVPVVQIDTEGSMGRLRVNLNDAPIWDGDPEKGDDVIRLAAMYFLHSEDPEGFDLGVLADALSVDRNDVEALS